MSGCRTMEAPGNRWASTTCWCVFRSLDSVFTSLMLGAHKQSNLMDNVFQMSNFWYKDANHIIMNILLLLFISTPTQITLDPKMMTANLTTWYHLRQRSLTCSNSYTNFWINFFLIPTDLYIYTNNCMCVSHEWVCCATLCCITNKSP